MNKSKQNLIKKQEQGAHELAVKDEQINLLVDATLAALDDNKRCPNWCNCSNTRICREDMLLLSRSQAEENVRARNA